MNRSPFRTRGLFALVVGALVLGGCSSDAGADVEPGSPGPLDDFLFRIHGSGPAESEEAALRAAAERHRLGEEMIAACMHEQGFDYLPVPMHFTPDLPEDLPPHGSLEFAEQWGFGIAHDAAGLRDWTPPEDPNLEMLRAMSEAELDAWWLALWGPPQIGQDVPEEMGCIGPARLVQWNSPVVDEQFASLDAELRHAQLNASMQWGPHFTEIHQDWRQCMADAGHPGLSNRESMMAALWEEENHLFRRSPALENWDWRLYPEGPPIPPPPAAQVEDLFRRELALALADYHCRAEFDFDARVDAARLAVQHEFVDRHRDELEGWALYNESRRAAEQNAEQN